MSRDNAAPSLEELYLEDLAFRDEARVKMAAFALYCKHDYVMNWHHRVICKTLDDWIAGKIQYLMVFAPPQTGKSQLTSRFLPAMLLGQNPKQHIILATYAADLASRMNTDVQRIIDSEEYKALFPNTRLNTTNVRAMQKMSGDAGEERRTSRFFEIMRERGSFRSAGRGQGISGSPAHRLIIDDLIKDHKEADSLVVRDAAWEWLNGVALARLPKSGSVLYTTTRWHEDEPAGRLLRIAKANPKAPQWTVIRFPALKEEDEVPYDPRLPGEALWPLQNDEKSLAAKKSTSTDGTWNAVYQQRPSNKEGNSIKRSWWKYYDVLPARFDEVIIVADPTFDDTKDADNVAFQCWGKIGAETYLIDSFAKPLEFTESCDEFEAFCRKHKNARVKLVEKKANGAAIISTFSKTIPGIIEFMPEKYGNKIQRVKAAAPRVKAGNVYLPNPEGNDEARAFIEECAAFPKGNNDDRVDCFSMAHLYWDNEAVGEFTDSMEDMGVGSLVSSEYLEV